MILSCLKYFLAKMIIICYLLSFVVVVVVNNEFVSMYECCVDI